MTNDELTVRTGQGLVRGVLENNGVRSWRSIPYAAPPVGAAQFRPPASPTGWVGVRDGGRFGPACPQPPLAGVPPREPTDEDCLFLNIWAPPGARELPVMVWIHGGGYLVGSGSGPSTAGLHLAKNGPAVIVTLNYRLGYRGFLDLSMLEGSAGGFATNLGLRDQIAALSWVRSNIRAFGGDPERVTIFGQSAGGGSVCCLVASPLARGLFSAAIAQSPPANSVFDRSRAAWVTTRFLELFGKPRATLDEIRFGNEAALMDASGRLLEEAAAVFPGHHAFQPVIDSDVLLDMPTRSVAAGDGSTVPLLIGSNDDEGSLFTRPPMPPLVPTSRAAVDRFLRQDHPGVATAVVEAYASHGRFGPEVAIGGDGMVSMPAVAVGEALSARAPVFVYRFRWSNHDLMVTKQLGTPHTLDVPFVFGTFPEYRLTDLLSPDSDGADRVSAVMQAAWLSFGRDHVPVIPGVPWSPYERDTRTVMVLDRQCSVEHDPDATQRRAWRLEVPASG